MADIKDLKNLPPEERIKRLKELAEKDKKEIEEAQKLIRDSEAEVEETSEMLKKVPIPQMRAVDIDSLFSDEEKDTFATMRFVDRKKPGQEKKAQEEENVQKEKNLEETLQQEKIKVSEQQLREQKEYMHQLGTVTLQKKRESIYDLRDEYGSLNEETRGELYTINQEMDQRRKDAEQGKYKTSNERVAEILGLHMDDSTRRHYH